MTIVKRGQTVSKEILESRRETSQPFKGGRQPIRIPIRRRGNCRDYSMFLTNSCTRFKQSPSIERRSDPTEDPSIPLNRNPVTRSKTEEILDVNKSDVEANVDLPFGRSHVECYTGAEELLTVQRFYRRIDEQTRHWLIDEAIDSTRFERVTRSRRGTCTGTIAISMLALCLLI